MDLIFVIYKIKENCYSNINFTFILNLKSKIGSLGTACFGAHDKIKK